MTDRIKYKDFIGSVHFSAEDEIFYGRIEGINDLITFEGSTVSKLKAAFKEAVVDYIELCDEVGKEIFKSFKGSFNVRVNPELHSKAFEHALIEGKSLNQFIKEAIELKLKSKKVSL
jgi:predicted HicB family RNase H-like nuclease